MHREASWLTCSWRPVLAARLSWAESWDAGPDAHLELTRRSVSSMLVSLACAYAVAYACQTSCRGTLTHPNMHWTTGLYNDVTQLACRHALRDKHLFLPERSRLNKCYF